MTDAPASIGIIMDGNRRWAKARNVPTLEGHRAGLEKVKEIAQFAFDSGVKNMYLYAFSTENWNRAAEEVSYLMGLFEHAIKTEFRELSKNDARVRFIGDLSRLPENLQKLAADLEDETKNNSKGTLAVALSYGGRHEIVHAVNKLIEEGKETITEEDISKSIWSHDIPDPDIIIRTSGEQRLSGFLTWGSIYSELFFTDTFWPDFSTEELGKIFAEYRERERRHGK